MSYRAHLLFRNGHISTVYAGWMRPVRLPAGLTRKRVELPDGDFLDMDVYPRNGCRMVILLHGLEGHSRRPYMAHMARYFADRGWDVVALNFRGCSGEPNRLLRTYHSGDTGDLRYVISHELRDHPAAEIHLIGFSLGGNVVMKYLEEEADRVDPRIRTGTGFSVPLDLASSCQALDRGLSRQYTKRFLRTLIPKALEKARQFPGRVDAAAVAAAGNFAEYDEAFTAPVFGFRDAVDYWTRASSLPELDRIAVPALIVNALDDPFLGEACFPGDVTATNALVHLETPRHGGHVAFPRWTLTGHYWPERRAYAFCASHSPSTPGRG